MDLVVSRPLVVAPPEAARPAAPLDFDAVYDENVDFVWRSARRLGVCDAYLDDVVQQVFLVVHRRLGEFEQRSSTRTWLFSIVLRAVADHKRWVRRKSPHWDARAAATDPDALATTIGADAAALQADAARTIDRLLDTLDDEKRTVFILAELEEMSASEIGEVTGLSPRDVYSRLRAARTDFERAAAKLRRETTFGRAR